MNILLRVEDRWRETARRVNLRRSASGDHAFIRMHTDNCDGAHLSSIERQQTVRVFEQHGTSFRARGAR